MTKETIQAGDMVVYLPCPELGTGQVTLMTEKYAMVVWGEFGDVMIAHRQLCDPAFLQKVKQDQQTK